jgi:putative acetyltransferase
MSGRVARPTESTGHAGLQAKIGFRFIQADTASRRGLIQALGAQNQASSMIREFVQNDMEAVLDVWLSASIKAHDFVVPDFWRSQLENMRNIYIPASEVYVHEDGSKLLGFYALLDDKLAAIFVIPDLQGKGIGKLLISHAKSKRDAIYLSVYKANASSISFYKSQGFLIAGESLDNVTGHEEYIMQWAPNNSFKPTPLRGAA